MDNIPKGFFNHPLVNNGVLIDRRRTRHHWAVTIAYRDGEQFQRVYTDERKARGFAARQEKSPVVGKATVRLIS